jgi:ABC-type sugar transport system ATPase subunit
MLAPAAAGSLRHLQRIKSIRTVAYDGHTAVTLSGKPWQPGSVCPRNRKTDGCFFNFEGPKNITISRLKALLRGPFLSLTQEHRFGETYLKRMNIPRTALERSVQFLSGGNQQKVIVARWLFSQARLLIMDEPTQGIDIGAKLEVYNVINELTAAGISILLISSDFPELRDVRSWLWSRRADPRDHTADQLSELT